MRTSFFLIFAFSFACNLSFGQTLLVDFGGNSSDTAGNQSSALRTLGTNADFRANDPNISATATVLNFDFPAGDQLVDSNSGLEAFVDIDMVDPSDSSLTSDPITFNPDNGLFADNTPILDGYYFALDSNDLVATIFGLEEVPAGRQVTLTVYAIGDQPNQDGNIEAFYNGISLGSQFTEADGPLSDTFAQFSFSKINGVDDLQFVNFGASSPFTAINGFSISTAVPEPSGGTIAFLIGLACVFRRRQ